MKTLQEMNIEQLNIELKDRQAAAFYGEIFNPQTDKEKQSNQDLIDWINEVEIEIKSRN